MDIKKSTTLRAIFAVLLVTAFLPAGMLVTLAIADFQRDQYFEVRKFQAAAAAASIEAADVRQEFKS